MKRTIPVLTLSVLLASASLIPSAWADGHSDTRWSHSAADMPATGITAGTADALAGCGWSAVPCSSIT